jgi:hypothetical protein
MRRDKASASDRRVGCVSGRAAEEQRDDEQRPYEHGALRRLSDGAIIARLLVSDERPALKARAERHDGRLVALVGG